jgi:acyl dehydratase
MSIEIFKAFPPTYSDWRVVDQARIDAFAEVTGDHQYIHVDPARAAETPLGGTIAHGYLTLSLLASMIDDVMPDVPGLTMGLNYGLNKVRFLAPVRAGKRLRGLYEVQEAEAAPGRIMVTWRVTLEIEGEEKPALVAEWLNLFQMEE